MSQSEHTAPEVSTPTSGRSRRLWVAAGLIVLILVAVAVIGYWYMSGGLNPSGSTVAEFSGTGDHTTETFQVRRGWQIHWETGAQHFAFAITGDTDFGTIVDRDQPGSGVTNRADPGTYHLEITADGPWTVRVVQGQ